MIYAEASCSIVTGMYARSVSVMPALGHCTEDLRFDVRNLVRFQGAPKDLESLCFYGLEIFVAAAYFFGRELDDPAPDAAAVHLSVCSERGCVALLIWRK